MNTSSNVAGSTEQPTVPEGWYPDGSGALRWWNGSQWTEHVHVGQPAASQHANPHDDYTTASPSKSRNKWLIPVIAVAAALALIAVASTGFLIVQAFKTAVPVHPTVMAPPAAPDTEADEYDVEKDADSDAFAEGFADVFAEREQFIIDQQLPLDGSMLTAVTPKQKEFIAELKREYHDLDLVFTDTEESVALAIAADACETSILSHHLIEQFSVRGFAITSPLITELVGTRTGEARTGTIDEIMRIAVKGTGYMCSADHQQWADGFDAIGGNW